jgi:hypothetical protein
MLTDEQILYKIEYQCSKAALNSKRNYSIDQQLAEIRKLLVLIENQSGNKYRCKFCGMGQSGPFNAGGVLLK